MVLSLWTTSSVAVSLDVSRQHVECSPVNLWSSVNCNTRQWEFFSFVGCDFLRQFPLKIHHLSRSATQAMPVRSSPRISQWLSWATVASYSSTFNDTQNCSHSIIDDQQCLTHTACAWADTIFSLLTEPNYLRVVRLSSLVFPSLQFSFCP